VTDARSQTDAAPQSGDRLGVLPDSTPEPEPNRAEMAAYLARAEKLVMDEREASRNRVLAIWSKPIPERVASGHAIEGLEITQTDPDGGIHLKCSRNQSRFREGDILCLNQGDPFSQPKLMVTLDEDRGAELVVSPYDQDHPWGELQKNQSSWMLDEGFIDLYHYFLDALREVGVSSIGRERILPFLLGHNHPALDPA